MIARRPLIPRHRSLIQCSLWVAWAVVLIAQPIAISAQTALPSLQFKKWSGDINVPDPVALSLDNQGRVYVTQTRRRKIQDLDIRQHREWIPDDLGLQTIEDKSEFFKRVLAIGGDATRQKKHVQDWNQDGQYDWRDLTVVSEVIYRLVDTNHDRQADQLTVFAEDFKTEVTGIAAGVLAHDGHVYATVAPDLWKLTDSNQDGVADSQQSLVRGFGLHIAYAGHDMHGLTVGPDGKIYWSIGDKGINVATADGRRFAYPHQGGIMRCNPDGSDFEVFAHGLRNVQEFAFDQYGNLFGVDNDADQPGEKERFVWIVEQMDAGWRCYYQYRDGQYNPWTNERLWDRAGEHHASYLVPPIRHYIDGPAGFKYNPGTALSPEFQGFFFLTGAPNGRQFAFRVEPSGDSFQMVDEQQVGSGFALVGLAFGPDGALYGADWDGGYPLDQKGSVIRMDVRPQDLTDSHRRLREEVEQLLGSELSSASPQQLGQYLSHPDMRVRLQAQFSLVAQNQLAQLVQAASDSARSEIARLHGVWGLGQLARREPASARDALERRLNDGSWHVRAQAAKTLGELPSYDGSRLIELLADEVPHVRIHAALAMARHPTPDAVAPLLVQASQLEHDQHYLRHALVSALARCARAEQLVLPDVEEILRLVATLALRRQGSPQIAHYLHDPSAWVADAAARGIHDDHSIPAALDSLAACLASRAGNRSEAFLRRAINANFRIGDIASAARLLDFAAAAGNDPQLRLECLEVLSHWRSPPVLDRVQGIRRDLDVAQRKLDPAMLVNGLNALILDSEPKVAAAAIRTAGRLDLALSLDRLATVVQNVELSSDMRVAALRTIDARTQSLLSQAARDPQESVRSTALELLANSGAGVSVAPLLHTIEKDPSLKARQTAIRLLSESKAPDAASALVRLGQQLREGQLAHEVQLDVFEAISRLAPHSEADGLIEAIKAQTVEFLPPELGAYRFSRSGGDPQQGERIFRTDLQAQCVRCHRVGQQGSEIGPDLSRIARERTATQLLTSIVQPSRDIDSKYQSQTLLLESGQVLTGVILSQNEQRTVLADSKGEQIEVPTAEIEATSKRLVSLMPEMKTLLTPRQVRDLVAYLGSLK